MENTATGKSEHLNLTCGNPVNIESSLDPHLQNLILMKYKNHKTDTTPGKTYEADNIIDVVVKLKNQNKQVPPDLEIHQTIGRIVTGSVDLSNLEKVRKHPNIFSLKYATPLYQEQDLNGALKKINATSEIINTSHCNRPSFSVPEERHDTQKIDGTGVIIGIVDYDCDFAHPNFRRGLTESRILFLWDQRDDAPGRGSSGKAPDGYKYGREFSRGEINSVLNSSDPYGKLGYDPGGTCSHGTQVLDIAAGNGGENMGGTGQPGVAPNADIIFVHLASEDHGKIPAGNSRRLIEAVKYILDKAGDKSAVVNISLGFRGGPHDGTTLVEEAFDTLLEKAGRAIVIAAGNSRSRRSHASGMIKPQDTRSLGWEIPRVDSSDDQIEIWYDGDSTLDVSLITPTGKPLGPIKPGSSVPLMEGDNIVGRIFHRIEDPNNEDNHILIILDRSLSDGWSGSGLFSEWKVELKNNSNKDVNFHSWIERARSGQSRFVEKDDDPSYTIGSLACGKNTIVVGSYDSTDKDSPVISESSGEGPTRQRRGKPEVIAPGHEILVACAKDWDHTSEASGTSVATPFVTGTIALIMHAAEQELGSNLKLNINEIRDAVIKTARKFQNPSVNWPRDRRYGHGSIDALAAVQSIVCPPTAVEAIPISLAIPSAND